MQKGKRFNVSIATMAPLVVFILFIHSKFNNWKNVLPKIYGKSTPINMDPSCCLPRVSISLWIYHRTCYSPTTFFLCFYSSGNYYTDQRPSMFFCSEKMKAIVVFMSYVAEDGNEEYICEMWTIVERKQMYHGTCASTSICLLKL